MSVYFAFLLWFFDASGRFGLKLSDTRFNYMNLPATPIPAFPKDPVFFSIHFLDTAEHPKYNINIESDRWDIALDISRLAHLSMHTDDHFQIPSQPFMLFCQEHFPGLACSAPRYFDFGGKHHQKIIKYSLSQTKSDWIFHPKSSATLLNVLIVI